MADHVRELRQVKQTSTVASASEVQTETTGQEDCLYTGVERYIDSPKCLFNGLNSEGTVLYETID